MKFPKGEVVWVSYYDAGGALRYILTSKPTREYYYMYEVGDGNSLTKLGKSKSPPELEEKFKVNKKIGVST